MLNPHAWLPETRKKLIELIDKNRNSGKKVIFDFDNTVICRDIGEATFAQLVKTDKLRWESIPENLLPEHQLFSCQNTYNQSEELTAYYDSVQDLFAADVNDRAPYALSYAWVIQIMEGLSPRDVVTATDEAFNNNAAIQDTTTQEYSKVLNYGRPFFYPQMVDLIYHLLENGFDCSILSASNIWTVRWMVLKHLNGQLRDMGLAKEKLFSPQDVRAATVLLQNPEKNELYKDKFLCSADEKYASMREESLSDYCLTSLLDLPFPAYTGKMACYLQDYHYVRPFLAIGDSPSDLSLLAFAEHRLWMMRLEKPAYQKHLHHFIQQIVPTGKWLFQPVATRQNPGFVPSYEDIPGIYRQDSETFIPLFAPIS